MKFTALMPLHDEINFNLFRKAIKSVLQNKLKPSEFIILVDGFISDEKKIFLLKQRKFSFIKIIFKKKIGISKILNYGLKISKYNIIARVDADDINDKYRFLKQINFFKKNGPDILGSNIEEIINGKKFVKRMPSKPNLFNFFLMNPINHMSVMFKRDRIISLGGYPEIKYKEDYCLWFLAMISNYNIVNLQDSLVKSRLDVMTLKRRKNIEAIVSEFKLQFMIAKKKFHFIFFCAFAFFIRVFFLMLPNSMYFFCIKKINRFKIV